MKSQLKKVVWVSAGAFVLASCSGCLENQAESEVPVVTAPPPATVVAPANTFVVEPAIPVPAEPLQRLEAAPAVPGVAPEAAEIPQTVAAAATTNAVSTNAVRVVQTVRPPENLKASPVVQEVIKLADAGVSDEVMLAYVRNSVRPYQLTSDEILYLNDLGVSTEVITAMIQKNGSTEAAKAAPAEMAPAPAAPPVAMNPATVPAPAPAAAPANGLPPAVTEAPAEQAAAAAAQPQQPVATTTFYSSLAPYGNWVEVPDYGLVWQPTVVVVNPTWRPYCDRGRWTWTDCGWYWYSDYSWGWAPFHYGRWCTYPRLGWVWVPDTTWGPSWVSWRYTSSYCGWAPLPPRAHYRSGFGFSYYSSSVGVSFDFGLAPHHYTFVPTQHFHHRNPRQYVVSDRQTTTVYRNSVVVNNYVSGNNNTVINRGFGKEPVVKATGTEIQTVHVRQSSAAPLAGRGEQLANNGSTIIAAKPAMQQHAAMRNSLQATRTAAFTPAAAVPSVASATTGTSRRAGEIVPASGAGQGRTGGRAQPVNLAKADAPAVPRVPAQTTPNASASSAPSSAPSPNANRGPMFTPGVGGAQQRFPANSRPENPTPQNPAVGRTPTTISPAQRGTVVHATPGSSAPTAVEANPFAGASGTSARPNTPAASGSVQPGSTITRGTDRPTGGRTPVGGFTRPNTAANASGVTQPPPPITSSLARNNVAASDSFRAPAFSRPSAAVTAPLTPRATPSAPMIPTARSEPPARTYAPVMPQRSAPAPSYSPPPSAPARSYNAPPSSNSGGNNSSGSARSSSNGRGRQDK